MILKQKMTFETRKTSVKFPVMNLLLARDMRGNQLRTPAGIVYLCQWCSLEEEWDWEAV